VKMECVQWCHSLLIPEPVTYRPIVLTYRKTLKINQLMPLRATPVTKWPIYVDNQINHHVSLNAYTVLVTINIFFNVR